MTLAIYPGSFDPMTNGHLDIARRAAKLFGKVVVAVYDTPDKRLMFTTAERVELAKEAAKGVPGVEVTSYTGLTVEYARKMGSNVVVRGLRMFSDFEHEFEMALMNKNLAKEIEIVCLMTSSEYQFISSSLLKDVAHLGGKIDGMVPPNIAVALTRKLHKKP